MISELEKLADSLAHVLKKYHPVKLPPSPEILRRRAQIKASMDKRRAKFRALGLNNQGKPFGGKKNGAR